MKTDRDLFRIVDANLNRSREGLRVCEEIARFVLRSKALTEELRSIRHRISNAIRRRSSFSRQIYKSRDAEGDIGKAAEVRIGPARADCYDIFAANIERVKESLRVLEEFTKLLDIQTSGVFSSLRFKIYAIEKRALGKCASLRDLGQRVPQRKEALNGRRRRS